MTKARQKAAASGQLTVTRQQATVWRHMLSDWQTVAEIHDFVNAGEDDEPVALNTVKNTVKWLCGLGAIEQAPHLTPARYRIVSNATEPVKALVEASRLYLDIDAQ
jgi:Fe2+ or Zn2+ uptake regulation protein